MLPAVALVFSALMTSVVGNYTLPATFDINKVTLTERAQWCTAERNTCPKICGGVATSNTCDASTLEFNCVCANGSTADVAPYMQTVPFFVCQANYGQCIANHPNDLDGQEECKENATCGSLNASAPSTTSSTTAATTLTTGASTAGATKGAASTTTSSSASETSTGAATAMRLAQEHSTSLLVTALFIAFRAAL